MDSTTHFDPQRIGRTFNLSPELVQKIAALLEQGFDPAFIARHRRNELPGVSDWQIFGVRRAINEELTLAHRRKALRAHLETVEELTSEKSDKIEAAKTTHQVDLLHSAWKRRRGSKSSVGKSDEVNALAIKLLAGEIVDDQVAQELGVAKQDPAVEAPTLEATEASSVANDASVSNDDGNSKEESATDNGADSKDTVSTTQELSCEQNDESPSQALSETSAGDQPSTELPTEVSSAGGIDLAQLKDALKEHLRGRIELYEGMSKFLRERGQITCQTGPQDDKVDSEPEPEPRETSNPSFAEGVIEKNDTPPEVDESSTEKETAVQVVNALGTDAPHVSAADIRRRRRKESRKRRRAHLETSFRDFVGAKIPVNKVLPWQYLLMDHADRLRILELVIHAPSADEINKEAVQHLPGKGKAPHPLVVECLEATVMHDILPELKRLLRKELSNRAQSHAAKYATARVRELLQAPAHPVSVMAIDVTAKSEAEIAVLADDGSLLIAKTWKLGDTAEQRTQATEQLKQLVEEHKVKLIALGEGNRARSLESLIAEFVGKAEGVSYAFINREGVEQYASSTVGSSEFPQHSAKSRAAISLGRRLQDPILEMTKIEPRHLVSSSWPLIPDDTLNAKLRDAVTITVTRLGIDLNRCGPALLEHAPGIDRELAAKIIEDRNTQGPFKSKQDLRRVAELNDDTFNQSISILRIRGENGLDHSVISPDQFEAATVVLEAVNLTPNCLAASNPTPTAHEALAALGEVKPDELATKLELEKSTIQSLKFALRDSILARRETANDLAIRDKPLAFEHLNVDDELLGTVSKVVGFGVFVDLGCGLTGLCHTSQMGNQVRDAREQFAIGDLKRVEVVSLDTDQRHIALRLTGVQTGTPQKRDSRSPQKSGGRGPKREKSPRRPKGGPRKPVEYTTKSKRKKAPPITDNMKSGKEPMRTFGDLKQFFDIDKPSERKSDD